MKKISILGSTGSVGTSAVKLISNNKDKFKVIALTANSNVEILAEQAAQLKPEFIAINDKSKYSQLRQLLKDGSIKVLAGEDAILEIASIKCDIVLSSIVGIAGLKPTYYAIKAGNNIALANKESLVCAGEILLKEAKKNNVKIIPVDSEHSALFQVFDFDKPELIEKIILTASGGPFLHYTKDQIQDVTIEQALKHPNWSMGAKITIDSATMMNKCLEIIEAYYLFPINIEQIDVIIHPESIIHSMVSYIDGTNLAQSSYPDMIVPIAYALSYPDRINTGVKSLDLSKLSRLTFLEPDYNKFEALSLAKQVLVEGQSSIIALNAANEVAVKKFLQGEIKFSQIIPFNKNALANLIKEPMSTIDDVVSFDKNVRALL
jgi:1-deoxy-D-xylulose-5-phosphate reductoisomerase